MGEREEWGREGEDRFMHTLITTAYPKQFQNLSFHHIWSKTSIQWSPSYKDTPEIRTPRWLGLVPRVSVVEIPLYKELGYTTKNQGI